MILQAEKARKRIVSTENRLAYTNDVSHSYLKLCKFFIERCLYIYICWPCL